ncbi:diacylglycerol kinase family protein [Pedobacter mucosus]|uniref:diacylglycerol kinase family protein n=1 Tax=Pedobacter mucosus TaxID=2895286 RepID=UPI001EE459F3|nr:diacylglycerol kinase family protein [Pedobacter mucosus]UKT65183.1 diacylglycerol kinase family protein [Pedobacter mucosus]
MQGNKKFLIRDRIKSFKYAFNGLRIFFSEEHNARIHVAAAILALGLAFYLELASFEWIAILMAIALVFIAEIFNTSVEKLADVVSPTLHPKIKIVKDLAAAAVLITAFLAVLIAGIIFLPKLFLL